MNKRIPWPSSLLCTKIFALCLLAAATGVWAETRLSVTILEEREHATDAFTQGLATDGTQIFESSGLYGKSFIRRYDAVTGEVFEEYRLPPTLFAEGLTQFNQALYLLTWQAGQLLVFNPETFKLQKRMKYSGQGWGLTHDQKHLIMSDGSERIYFRNPASFEVERVIKVHNHWRRYKQINELEYAKGALWANVWLTPYILKIAPDTGKVMGIAELNEITQKNSTIPQHTVLNGIAYDSKRDAFWVTGKLWPRRYLVRFGSGENTKQAQPESTH